MKSFALALALAVGLTLLPEAASAGGPGAPLRFSIGRGHHHGFKHHGTFRHHGTFERHGAFKHHGHQFGFRRHGFRRGFDQPGVHPKFFRAPQWIWVPGAWHWNGFQWVWVSGHWRAW